MLVDQYRCTMCGFEGEEGDWESKCTFYGNQEEPPEYEAWCPGCGADWDYSEEIEQGGDN